MGSTTEENDGSESPTSVNGHSLNAQDEDEDEEEDSRWSTSRGSSAGDSREEDTRNPRRNPSQNPKHKPEPNPKPSQNSRWDTEEEEGKDVRKKLRRRTTSRGSSAVEGEEEDERNPNPNPNRNLSRNPNPIPGCDSGWNKEEDARNPIPNLTRNPSRNPNPSASASHDGGWDKEEDSRKPSPNPNPNRKSSRDPNPSSNCDGGWDKEDALNPNPNRSPSWNPSRNPNPSLSLDGGWDKEEDVQNPKPYTSRNPSCNPSHNPNPSLSHDNEWDKEEDVRNLNPNPNRNPSHNPIRNTNPSPRGDRGWDKEKAVEEEEEGASSVAHSKLGSPFPRTSSLREYEAGYAEYLQHRRSGFLSPGVNGRHRSSEGSLLKSYDHRSSSRSALTINDLDHMRMRRVSQDSRASHEEGEEDENEDGEERVSLQNYSGLKALRLAVQEHELPMKMAYKQLDELAANAERVKSAIENNRNLLLLQVKKSNVRYLRSAFAAWMLYSDEKVLRKKALKRAQTSLNHGLLSRAFTAWSLYLFRNRKVKRLQLSVEKVLKRHCLERIWKSWLDITKKSLQKEDDQRREKRLMKDLDEKLKKSLERRATHIMHRNRVSRAFKAFMQGCEFFRIKKEALQKILRHLKLKKIGRFFNSWRLLKEFQVNQERAVKKIERLRSRRYFKAWKQKDAYLEHYRKRFAKGQLSSTFVAWTDWLKREKFYTKLYLKIKRNHLRILFSAFNNGCTIHSWNKSLKKQVSQKILNRRLKMAFQAWVGFIQIQAQKKLIKLQDYVKVIESESQRSRTECDRLSRIVESGEWNKKQLAEILQAREVLSEEREALQNMIKNLQAQLELAHEQQLKSEDETQLLKDSLLGNDFIGQNKLLVKGVSSFNSVVRAVKTDAIKRGVNPNLLYGVNGMAMEKVSVFADGEIRVKTLRSTEKGKWLHRNGNPSLTSNTKQTSSPPNQVTT